MMPRKKRIIARIEGPSHKEKDVRENEDRFNWLPLLLIPIFFILGWSVNDAVNGKGQVYESRQQVGVGGGPGTGSYCITPPFAP
jgi:hypothetical protein